MAAQVGREPPIPEVDHDHDVARVSGCAQRLDEGTQLIGPVFARGSDDHAAPVFVVGHLGMVPPAHANRGTKPSGSVSILPANGAPTWPGSVSAPLDAHSSSTLRRLTRACSASEFLGKFQCG